MIPVSPPVVPTGLSCRCLCCLCCLCCRRRLPLPAQAFVDDLSALRAVVLPTGAGCDSPFPLPLPLPLPPLCSLPLGLVQSNCRAGLELALALDGQTLGRDSIDALRYGVLILLPALFFFRLDAEAGAGAGVGAVVVSILLGQVAAEAAAGGEAPPAAAAAAGAAADSTSAEVFMHMLVLALVLVVCMVSPAGPRLPLSALLVLFLLLLLLLLPPLRKTASKAVDLRRFGAVHVVAPAPAAPAAAPPGGLLVVAVADGIYIYVANILGTGERRRSSATLRLRRQLKPFDFQH